MRKLILLSFFIFVSFVSKSQGVKQDFNHVWRSKETISSRPVIVYVNYGSDFYLTFRDGKRTFDYKLNLIGNKMQGGLIEYNFKAIDEKMNEVKGLSFRVVTSDGSGIKSMPPTLTIIADEKDLHSFELLAL